jgi:hypothetical protein
MMLPAVGLLAAGLVGDAYVTVRKISDMPDLALVVTIAAAAGFATLLYVVPWLAKRGRQGIVAASRPG